MIQSKDYQILVERLETEMNKLIGRKMKLYQNFTAENDKTIQIIDQYLAYHEEMIRFIRKLDEEMQYSKKGGIEKIEKNCRGSS